MHKIISDIIGRFELDPFDKGNVFEQKESFAGRVANLTTCVMAVKRCLSNIVKYKSQKLNVVAPSKKELRDTNICLSELWNEMSFIKNIFGLLCLVS